MSPKQQYQEYLKQYPKSLLTYEEWLDEVWEPTISDNFQIGPDGAYEHDEDLSDWDVTLLDGLED